MVHLVPEVLEQLARARKLKPGRLEQVIKNPKPKRNPKVPKIPKVTKNRKVLRNRKVLKNPKLRKSLKVPKNPKLRTSPKVALEQTRQARVQLVRVLVSQVPVLILVPVRVVVKVVLVECKVKSQPQTPKPTTLGIRICRHSKILQPGFLFIYACLSHP